MEFNTETGTTERKNLNEMTSANNTESGYDTFMGTLSGLSQANSGKTGAERAVGLGKVGYGTAKAIQWLTGALL